MNKKKEKKLDEIEEQKNVIELMSDMLREQESHDTSMMRRIKSSSAFLMTTATGDEERDDDNDEAIVHSNMTEKTSRYSSANDERRTGDNSQKVL